MTPPMQRQLLNVLKMVDRPGTFCTSGHVPPVLPGLEVTGPGATASDGAGGVGRRDSGAQRKTSKRSTKAAGAASRGSKNVLPAERIGISLPLGKHDATALRRLSRQAPYGKGTQTLVDTDVRRVWEIDAEQVTLGNPQWPDVLATVVASVQSALGLEEQKLSAHLYKLLLYEPGGFFLAHRDGEKLERMVATLVIALPSVHEGGELLVRHEGREEKIDFAAGSQFATQFAAFYADCEHEVRPVTCGFRLALVYNLTLEKSKRRTVSQIGLRAPTSREHIAAAAHVLRQWTSHHATTQGSDSSDDTAPSRVAVLLDHQYTKAGLTRDALKGLDRTKADILFAAAREAGCDASLALVTLWESGSAADPDDDMYGWGRRRRSSRHDRREDDDADPAGDPASERRGMYEMEEVFDSRLIAEHFSDAEGKPLAFGEIPLDESQIVSEAGLTDRKPDEEDFEGYTGNAGMTLERWYHRAAVVLWPAEDRFDVLCEAGEHAAVGGLAQMVRRWKRARKSEQEALRQPCVEFARRIIANWPQRKFALRLHRIEDEKKTPTLLLQLELLADPALVSSYIERVLANDASVDPGPELGNLCRQHGWLAFREELGVLMASTSAETMERHARLLADFALRREKEGRADRTALCAELAPALMSAVERWDPGVHSRNGQNSQHEVMSWEATTINLTTLLPPLVQSFLTFEAPALLERLVTFVLNHPKAFHLTTIQVPALLALAPWMKRNLKRPSAPLDRWLASVRETLEARAADAPSQPADWARAASTRCTCPECGMLARFLQDPECKTVRLPLAQEKRQHLERIIESQRLDITCTTETRGRPYTLVCTKTQAAYERALKAHHVDLEHLAQIRDLIDSMPAG